MNEETVIISSDFDLAAQHAQEGRLDLAEKIYHRILESHPDHPRALHALGVISFRNGKGDSAIALLRHALEVKPDYAEAHNNLGNIFRELGKLNEAATSYRQALAVKPDFALAHNNLGNILRAMGQSHEALTHLNKAISYCPDFFDAHIDLGNVLIDLGRLDEAVTSCQKAVALKPDSAIAYNSLGVALTHLGKLNEARISHMKSLALFPKSCMTLTNLGNVFSEEGKFDEAVENYQKAIAVDPSYAEAHNNLGLTLIDLGKHDEAIAAFRQALAAKAVFVKAHSNMLFAMNYSPNFTLESICRESLRWDIEYGSRVAVRRKPHANDRNPERRLRIGYVSPDFHMHPIGFFIEPLLTAHDRDSVEIFCYSDVKTPDNTTVRLQHLSDKWRNCHGMADESLAEQVRTDCIDILIDLAGHTAGNRLLSFAEKPAPVQASWLGYSATTGLSTIDYVIADTFTVSPEEESFFSEKVLRLPDNRFCYAPPVYSPPVARTPALAKGQVTFGCFNNLAKITPEVVALWANLLHAVPAAKLILKWKSLGEPSACDRYRHMFAVHGINAERLELRGWSSHAAMLAEYGDVDIALDPFPFSGGLTTCEALWMGVPVITRSGTLPISRQTKSFLTTIGLPDMVAHTDTQYVRIAARLASDPLVLDDFRQGIRPRMAASALLNRKLFAHNMETIYRTMWQHWCNDPR